MEYSQDSGSGFTGWRNEYGLSFFPYNFMSAALLMPSLVPFQ